MQSRREEKWGGLGGRRMGQRMEWRRQEEEDRSGVAGGRGGGIKARKREMGDSE